MPKRRKYIKFKELTEEKKDAILKWILINQKPIRLAGEHFNLPSTTISKIYEERFKPKKEKLILKQKKDEQR